ncbi:MAG TPA: ABC transporter ATP-binding protein [Candidatus Dormibacteraeota bacterium]|nr:ABC transporter ATP-binding protein [Candidatus Dormibacteraeota bacterium]
MAVTDLTFTVPRGQVLGLLGPDDAGKSTTLRVLAGSVAATSGTVRVAGWDVEAQSREARHHVGYLAERTPLYDEMRVGPYVAMMANLRGVPRRLRRARVDGALEACGLGDRRREVIGRLAAGARVRVGLAQAVVHGPEVLLLDEPAAGLDVEQAGETRALVAELALGRTVMVSGRTLAEVDALCDRVLCMEAGRLVADEPPARVSERRTREVMAVVAGDAAELERQVRALVGVTSVAVSPAGENVHRVTVAGDREDLQDAIARTVVEGGFGLRELTSRPAGGEGSA